MKIKETDVISVYSGKPGCACGCRGHHTSSPRSISRIVKTVEKLDRIGVDAEVTKDYIAAESLTRLYIIYLKNPTFQREPVEK